MALDPNKTVQYELKGEITQLLKDLKLANVDTALLEKELLKVEQAIAGVSNESRDQFKKMIHDLKAAGLDTSKLEKEFNGLGTSIKGTADKQKGFFSGFMSGLREHTKGLMDIQAGWNIITGFINKAKNALRFTVELKNAQRDVVEIQNKFNAVFASISMEANKTAKEISIAYGLAESTTQQYLASTGDILVGLGYSERAAFDYAKRVVTLSQDLASFTNIQGGAATATMALSKLLVGETESAKALGIVIRQDQPEFIERVKTFKELNGVTETQARAAILLTMAEEQSAKASGDFARTRDQLANKERILSERYKEQSEELGENLLPIFNKWNDLQLDMLDMAFGDELDNIRKEAGKEALAFETLAAKVEYLSGKQEKSKTEQQEYAKALEEIKKLYPEYLQDLDSEKTAHQDIVKALGQQRGLTREKIIQNMYEKEKAELIQRQASAQIDLIGVESELYRLRDASNEQNFRTNASGQKINKNYIEISQLVAKQTDLKNDEKEATEALLIVDTKYNATLEKINQTHAEALAKESERQEALRIAAELAEKERIAKEKAEAERKKADADFQKSLDAKVEAHDKEISAIDKKQESYRKMNVEVKALTTAINELIVSEIKSKDIIPPDLSVNLEAIWQSVFKGVTGVGEALGAMTAQQWTEALEGANWYAQSVGQITTGLIEGDLIDVENAKKEKLRILDEQYTQDMKGAASNAKKKKLLEEQYNKSKIEIERQAEKDAKSAKEKQRDMEVAMAISNGILAVQKTYATLGWPWGIIPAGVMTGISAVNVSNMMKLKFRDGGLAEGATHENGGIPVKMGGRMAEIEHHEIINARPVYEHPVTRALANFNQVFHNKRRIPNARDVKSVNLEYKDGGRDTLMTRGHGLPSASKLFFRDGGLADTGGTSYSSSGSGGVSQIDLDRLFSKISFNITAESDISTEKLAYKVAVVQNKMKAGGLNLDKV